MSSRALARVRNSLQVPERGQFFSRGRRASLQVWRDLERPSGRFEHTFHRNAVMNAREGEFLGDWVGDQDSQVRDHCRRTPAREAKLVAAGSAGKVSAGRDEIQLFHEGTLV